MGPLKIAVLRANALGDFIFVLPALHALKETYPSAEIVLLGKEMHKKFLQNRPSPVDRVEIVPPYKGVGAQETDIELSEKFFARMRKECFDIAIQMHGGGRYSNRFINRLGAGLTLGSRTPDAEALDISIPYTTYFPEILRYLEIVSHIGARTRFIKPVVAVTEDDILEAAVCTAGVPKPYIVIHPGATDPRRHWPAEKFSKVADHFAARGFLVFINGVREEIAIVERIIAGMEHPERAINAGEKLSVSGLAGLLSQSALLISNDSGPLHLAYAINVPSIGLYWVGNMITGTPITSASNKPLISWMTTCPACGLEVNRFADSEGACTHRVSLISSISVEEVLQASEELLNPLRIEQVLT